MFPMQSKAATVAEYLDSLPPDRRAAISAVRDVILQNLDSGYVEGMQYGMIGYSVPKGLQFAALASQKGYMTLHLMALYVQDSKLLTWFKGAWEKTGKKLDMGKACIRFKKLDDLPLEVIGEAIRRVPARTYVEQYTKARTDRRS